MASIRGTLQSTLTDFKYLRTRWKSNTEEERLLGVSLTGILDCKHLSEVLNPRDLQDLKNTVVLTNMKWAGKLGIPQSTATTCVKPSGTVSQLTNAASGIHARHAPFYVRTVRGAVRDPFTHFLLDCNIPTEPASNLPSNTHVSSFHVTPPNTPVCVMRTIPV